MSPRSASGSCRGEETPLVATSSTPPYRQPADYYVKVIEDAARRLRAENVGHLVATDLEDSLRWSDDPQTCSHPYWNCRTDGSTVCRTCGYDTSHIDPMGG